MGAPDNFAQNGYRLRNDDGSETGASWRLPINTVKAPDLGVRFRIRFLIQRDAVAADHNGTFSLYESHNGGTSIKIDESTKTIPGGSTEYSQGDNTTQQLGSATYNAIANNKCMVNENTNGDAQTENFTWTGDVSNATEQEIEYSLTIPPGNVANGDTLEYRVREVDTILDGGYNEIPVLTIVKGGLRINSG